MNQDLLNIFTWWSTFFLVGLISAPVTFLLFKDRFLSSAFIKTVGFIFITFTIFVLSSLKIAPFSNFYLYLVIGFWIIINLAFLIKHKDKLFKMFKKNIRVLILQEILFTFGLLTWSYVRTHQPDILGLEKLMDFGFINSILRTKYLPPADMWFAGKSINYYWFGHLWVAVATKITQIPSYITYNLMLATIMGLSLSGSFAIATFLLSQLKPKSEAKASSLASSVPKLGSLGNSEVRLKTRAVIAAGILSGFALILAGNFHSAVYVLKEGKDKYWYPDATRFIGYNPETNDKTIHEFPIYSFIVSDLHPHLINLPIVLMFIGLLASFMKDFASFNYKKTLVLGFTLGIFFMANTWDFGNYLLVSGVTIFIFNLKKHRLRIKTFIHTALQTGTMLLIALLTSLLFIIHFESIAQGVALVKTHSPLWQLAILWGFPLIITILYWLTLFLETKRFKNVSFSDLFTLSLLASAWILILLPEVIYVKDIYTASYYRANTMFKLTYQAFVIFYTLCGYIAIRTLIFLKELKLKIPLLLIYVVIFSAIFMYPAFGIKSYYSDLKNYKGLSGNTWLKERYPEIYQAVGWFRISVPDQPVILEAPGDSYTEFNIISSYSGLPTVSGWFVHEWLWRGDSKFPQERVGEIDQIYQSEDIELTKRLLEKYQVKFVIIGPFERQKFQLIKEDKFRSLGGVVFQTPGITVYKVK
ncbi:hypothetical protein A2962_00705 [Candidatus Woesebacteria bacterium RIFCSPLOWO2_01_FULL_39_61]|uniref:YYY membrane protein n=1 Tax=Candidatus Woesebacteria bacterium RIFCSPHIGHO2_02_FULL_39_13 TaxID=1802505 RepID=A0A1F7Z238_9BACT|nr:MAG: hypothetical protein A2692_04835 [Candidatus Woesebacteria bacterium RIFCSPHIGHO2_01_FULL_39_95]OGM33571.1 MAG: hypothetical protein A3D01_01290 [Candidatus Woesebacteria bacterium RIFCSPHIGHO2_02_FULL_39_13]OGM36699.1 MAG: hypothetical protein A3E13_00200 [Candidatus Woesebacteria bacterium RIFCSPHIGHO2_12_FULL_40_20]OGM68572.1 MAG: hypothetical protein A2962_00705 [Candidatus Woesebacteria bacterium RIFCSPLOWO2_01_FULL_39_61]OGM71673.1 MAG: hypothetical protein A3H19_01490 [Candidatus